MAWSEWAEHSPVRSLGLRTYGATLNFEAQMNYAYPDALRGPYWDHSTDGQTYAQMGAWKEPRAGLAGDTGLQTNSIDMPLLVLDLAHSVDGPVDRATTQVQYRNSSGIDIDLTDAIANLNAAVYIDPSDPLLAAQFDGATLKLAYLTSFELYQRSPGVYSFIGERQREEFRMAEPLATYTFHPSSSDWHEEGAGTHFFITPGGAGWDMPATLHIPAEKCEQGPVFITAWFERPGRKQWFDRRMTADGDYPYSYGMNLFAEFGWCTYIPSGPFEQRTRVPEIQPGKLAIVHNELFSDNYNIRPLNGSSFLTGGTSVTLVRDYGTGYHTWPRKIGYHMLGDWGLIPDADMVNPDTGDQIVYLNVDPVATDVGDGEFHVVALGSSYAGGGYLPWRFYIFRFRRVGGNAVYLGRLVLPAATAGDYGYATSWSSPGRYVVHNDRGFGGVAQLGLLTYADSHWSIEAPATPAGVPFEIAGLPITTHPDWVSTTQSSIGEMQWLGALGSDRWLAEVSFTYYTGDPYVHESYSSASYPDGAVIGYGWAVVQRNGPGDWEIISRRLFLSPGQYEDLLVPL